MPAFLFDWPTVSANNSYATVRTAAGTRRIVSPAARAWRDGVILTVAQSGQPCPEGDLRAAIYCWPRSWTKRRDRFSAHRAEASVIRPFA